MVATAQKGIVFGDGYLGRRIGAALGYTVSAMQVLDYEEVSKFLDAQKPDVVINCVAQTGRPNIDWCETNKAETLLSNVAAAVLLASACANKNIYFVHLGTASVFIGDKGGKGFTEEDEPNFAGNFYVRSKRYAEQVLVELPCLQIRINMPFDSIPNPRNLIDKLKSYPRLTTSKSSMTAVPDMIAALRALIGKRKTGMYHIVNPGTISAAEIMTMYKELVDPLIHINVVEDAALGMAAKRSPCHLNTDKIEKEGIVLADVHEAVRNCLIEYRRCLK